ncbi:MAG: hypothetical protein KDA22_02350 [Phycisphaerales bacterium]|nr:hypothetical protein [Phycisphaerales bacterium]
MTRNLQRGDALALGLLVVAMAPTALGHATELSTAFHYTPILAVASSEGAPGDDAAAPSTTPASAAGDDNVEGAPTRTRLRSWELPPVTVVGEAPPGLRENELVGSYRQPRWTASRRFPTTRVYVIPEGKVEVEAWARGTFKNGESEWRFLQELEIGLPYRFQLDLYLRQDYSTDSGDLLWGGQFEVRWALADWGVIWGNPTLYFEYITLEGRPDKIEPKLLFGGGLGERWHWGVNLVAELELGGEEEYEYQVTSALSYTVLDSVFSVGIENILSLTDTKDNRGDFATSFVIGPSVQWRPVPPLTLNIAPLFGVTDDSPELQLWLNMGWEF